MIWSKTKNSYVVSAKGIDMKLKDVVTDIFIDFRKLAEYTLNLDKPKGADLAIMFKLHLGFTKNNYHLCFEFSIQF